MNFQGQERQTATLENYIKGYITEKKYFRMIQMLLDEIENVHNQGRQIIMDIRMVQMNGDRLQFQTVKEDSVLELSSICGFIKKITFGCVFAQDENLSEVTDFLKFMDDSDSCRRISDLYEFCVDQNYDETEEASSPIVSNGSETKASVMEDSGETGILDINFWKSIERNKNLESDETGVLDPGFWNQVEKISGSAEREKRQLEARLIHSRSGNVTVIRQEKFWIGKENSDLVLQNPTVSRRHAMILCQGNHFFITDNGSTNKTYVSGKEIPAHASVEIYDGTKIKFANEEYTFQIL